VLLEVHVAREETKSGFLPEELEDVWKALPAFSYARVRGLMTMATNTDEEAEIHRCFRLVESQKSKVESGLSESHFGESGEWILSMGMSDDFELAIADGSNMVRIGTSIFGVRV